MFQASFSNGLTGPLNFSHYLNLLLAQSVKLKNQKRHQMDRQVYLRKSFHDNKRLGPQVLAAVVRLRMRSTVREFGAIHKVPD